LITPSQYYGIVGDINLRNTPETIEIKNKNLSHLRPGQMRNRKGSSWIFVLMIWSFNEVIK
jgi:hypothetical protein